MADKILNIQEQVEKNREDILSVKQSMGSALPEPIAGPKGDTGDTGPIGPTGPRGASLFGVRAALPSVDSYQLGDMFLLTNGNIYKNVQINGVNQWILQTNIKGQTGPIGPRGDALIVNPEGTPTDYITKLDVNGTIWGIPAGVWGQITGTLNDQTDLKDKFDTVIAIAEGKTKTYVINDTYDIAFIKSRINNDDCKVFLDNVDITQKVLDGDYDLSYSNTNFNSQNDTVVGIYMAVGDIPTSVEMNINFINIANLNVGDIILVINTEVPDRWLSNKDIYTWHKLETSKIDLDNYVTTNTNQTISGTKTFTSGNNIFNGEIQIGTSGILKQGDNGNFKLETINSKNLVIEPAGAIFLSNSSGGANYTTRPLIPSTSGINLGGASNYYSNVYTNALNFDDNSLYVDQYNELHLKAGNVDRLSFAQTSLYPITDNYFSLGSSSNKFKDLYLSGNISDGNTTKSISELLSGAVMPSVPTTDGTYVLKCTVTDGVASFTWVAE